MKNKSVKLLLYCTKGKPNLTNFNGNRKHFNTNYGGYVLNGKVVAEAECDLVEKMGLDTNKGLVFDRMFNKESQLTMQEMTNYVGDNYYYAIHLKNVKPFNKPKELSEYHTDNFQEFVFEDTRVRKAPQNMMYCYDKKGNLCVLISIQPQWLCKILNGEKTIECRKRILKVLKEMIK